MDLYTSALTILMTLSPPSAPHVNFPGWAETTEARVERYKSIASDVSEAIHDRCISREGDETLLKPDEEDQQLGARIKARRERCERWGVTLVLAIASHETGFAPDTDKGPCYRVGKLWKRCDAGTSFTIYQLKLTREEGARAQADRKWATTRAFDLAEQSLHVCHGNVPEQQLAAYAGGTCTGEEARQRAEELEAVRQRAVRALLTPQS